MIQLENRTTGKCFVCFFFLFFLFLLIEKDVFGQSDIVMNHKWLTRLDHNPAAIENSEYLDINLMTRNQWLDFGGGPASQILTVAGFLENYNSGIGLVVINDKIGYTRRTDFKLAYAYQLQFDKNLAWSLGLSGGLMSKSFDRQQIDMMDPTLDPEIVNLEGNKIAPDLDFGMELIHPRFRLGASVNHLASFWGTNLMETTLNNYVYLIGNIKPSKQWTISPGLYFVNRQNVSVLDANTMFQMNRSGSKNQHKPLLWFGASYRFSVKEGAAMAGVYPTENLSLGYSYQTNFGPMGRNSTASHELILRLKIKLYDKRKPCPAFAAQDYWNDKLKQLRRR